MAHATIDPANALCCKKDAMHAGYVLFRALVLYQKSL